ncbi:protein TIS11 isoform X2 [Diabrotica virgifera virgifera]|uniref:C3H1-type domain-containing protein n=1 Tax=Diabrotica virgifera virgifera TaxID=50390 RepID=A0ABM5KDP0_DIAVI|nr:protein TIS11 isoform X2 [Diabrotica virgifera virgifera]
MSTAIMSQNAMYEFGESLIKVGQSKLFFRYPTNNEQSNYRNEINGITPDSTTTSHIPIGSTQMRLTLTRMASTPIGQASSNQLAALLDNLTQHRRLERTQSAPAPQVSAPAAAVTATTVNTSRYKTELCRPFEEFGVCKYGDKCQFAHGMSELRSLARHPKYKTELCRTYHTVGFCPYGPRCHFVHNQDEVTKPPMLSNRPSSVTPRAARPAALSPSLSLDSPSPPCSLSQSPTSSMGSFFSSEPELHSPGVEDQRLPVFNRFIDTTQILTLSDLIL